MKRKNDEVYEEDEISQGNRAIINWGITLLIVAVIAVIVFALLRPTLLGLEAKANKASDQYVTSKVTHLETLKSDYLRLETEIGDFGSDSTKTQQIQNRRNQQAATLNTMWSEYNLVQDKSLVPDDIKQFLDKHPQ